MKRSGKGSPAARSRANRKYYQKVKLILKLRRCGITCVSRSL